MRRTFLLAGALLLTGHAALALTSEQVIDDLTAQGYTRIEVRNGLTQTKVEAIRGTTKLEVIYDQATGAILKSETEAVEPGDDTTPGISVRNRNRDFVRVSGRDDSDDSDDDSSSDDDDDRRDWSDDDDDDSRGRDDDSDDDSDDDRGDDHGGDDHGGDDRGGDEGGGDDRGGEGHGGDSGGDGDDD